MWIFIFLASLCVLCLTGGYIFFWVFLDRLEKFERSIITLFSSRSDSLCQLYEVSRDDILKHEQIFQEVLELRKQEFMLSGMSHNIPTFLQLQSAIHHEINFIFQICNKNPKLLKNKKFLYVREHILEKSSKIRKTLEVYKKLVKLYNTCIHYKNLTWIGLLLPYHKKEVFT